MSYTHIEYRAYPALIGERHVSYCWIHNKFHKCHADNRRIRRLHMGSGIGKTMSVGQVERLHLKVYGQDNVNNPSQVVDLTTPLVVTVPPISASVLSAVVDPNDNRAVLVTALAPTGGGFVVINTNPALPANTQMTITIAVTAPPPDDRRLDFLAADDPA